MRRKDGKPQAPRGVRYICGRCRHSFGNNEMACKRHMREVHGTLDPVPTIAVDKKGRQHRLLTEFVNAPV